MMEQEILGSDPLARAAEAPDVTALQHEFELALNLGPGQATALAWAEATRYNWREGKSDDGLLHQRNLRTGTQVRPYDHRPDSDVPLADSTVNTLVDFDMVGLNSARVNPSSTHASMLSAKQIAQVRALIEWMRRGPLAADLLDDGELASQVKNTNGWAVLHPCWKTRYALKKETLNLDQILQLAQAAPDSDLGKLPLLIADPTLEAEAVALIQQAYPYLKPATAKRVVRELREEGETSFPYRELAERGPSLRVFVPGINIFVSTETQKLARARCIITLDYYSAAELQAMVVDDGWDQAFVDQALNTSGQTSIQKNVVANAVNRDPNNRNIEILTSYVMAVDDDGVRGIYCTIFSNHVKPDAQGKGGFAKHFLLDYAHGQYPFIEVRTEVTGLRPSDSRGVAQVLRTDQIAAKRLQDAVLIDAELSTPSMLKRVGGTMMKMAPEIKPGGVWDGPPGTSLEPLPLTQFTKPEMNLKLMEVILNRRDEYFRLPNTEGASHPALWQIRQSRNSLRWLQPWGQAFWQLAVLCCAEYSADELGSILGAPPVINADLLRKCNIWLQFDVRTMDSDWLSGVLSSVSQFIVPMDRAGVIDMGKFVNFMLSAIDPTLAGEITTSQQGAANAIFNEVRQEVAWIMQGNEANYTQNDATAGMKLQFLGQILQQNPAYQAILLPVVNGQPNPQFNAMIFEKMKKYEENLQHSVQETTISPAQGRLGVTPGGMEQGPQQVLPEDAKAG